MEHRLFSFSSFPLGLFLPSVGGTLPNFPEEDEVENNKMCFFFGHRVHNGVTFRHRLAAIGFVITLRWLPAQRTPRVLSVGGGSGEDMAASLRSTPCRGVKLASAPGVLYRLDRLPPPARFFKSSFP